MSLLKSHLIAICGIMILIVMAIVIANQPTMFLADVMQGKNLEHMSNLDKVVLGNTVRIISNIELQQVKQIDLVIHHSPETILFTPMSAYELFQNTESDQRIKIILKPQAQNITAGTTLIHFMYEGDNQINISDVIMTQTDGNRIPLSISS